MRWLLVVLVLVLVLVLVSGCASQSAPPPCALAPGELVITEVMANPSGPDTGREWFEIYADQPVELAGATIAHSRADGSGAVTHRMTALAAHGYVVLGSASPDRLPPYVDYGYGGDLGELFDTGGGKLVLSCGAAVIDAVTYDHVSEGHSRELAAGTLDANANDDPARWCDCDDTPAGDGDFATPGRASDCTPLAAGQCRDGPTSTRAIRAPPPGALAISEVMANPKIEPAEEWFEIANTGAAEFDLNGLALDRAGDARAPEVIDRAACMPLASGAFAVFAHSADATLNGGLPTVAATFDFALVNSSGDVRVLAGTNVLASASWSTSTDGVSMQLLPAPCPAIDPYGDGANKGTPGQANRCAN